MRAFKNHLTRYLFLLACLFMFFPCITAEAAVYTEDYIVPYSSGRTYVGYNYVPELSGSVRVKSVKWTVSDKRKLSVSADKNSLYASVVYKKSGSANVTRTVRLRNGKTIRNIYHFRVYAKNTWMKVNGHTYYYLKNGGYASDKWIGRRYVNQFGQLDERFVKDSQGVHYKKADGSYAAGEWVETEDGNEYYFNSSGAMVTNSWVEGCYLQKDGKKKSGLVETETGWKMQSTNWEYDWDAGEYVEKTTYYSDIWQSLNGKKVYFDAQGNMVKNQWSTINRKKYYFDQNGYMAENTWIDGYYVNESGYRVKNQRAGDYYVDSTGKKARNKWIKGYYVNGSGKIQKNRWIKGSYVGLNGKKIKNMRYTTGKTAVNGACLTAGRSQLKKLVSVAVKQLGKPYIWGGNGPDGFDCSGFVNYCYRALGFSLPRTTYYLYNSGVNIDPTDVSEWQIGDLLVNQGDINGGSAGHVVMYIGNGKVIHCTGGGVQYGDAYAFAGRYSRVRRILYVK